MAVSLLRGGISIGTSRIPFSIPALILFLACTSAQPLHGQSDFVEAEWANQIVERGNSIYPKVTGWTLKDARTEWVSSLALLGYTERAFEFTNTVSLREVRGATAAPRFQISTLLRLASELAAVERGEEADVATGRAIEILLQSDDQLFMSGQLARTIVSSGRLQSVSALVAAETKSYAPSTISPTNCRHIASFTEQISDIDVDKEALKKLVRETASRYRQELLRLRSAAADDSPRRERNRIEIRDHMNHLEAFIDLGRAAWYSGDRPTALGIASWALGEASRLGSVYGLFTLADLYGNMGDDEKSQAIVQDVRNRVRAGLGVRELQSGVAGFLKLGLWEDAERAISIATKHRPTVKGLYSEWLVQARLRYGQPGKALHVVRRLAVGEKTVGAYGHLGWAAYQVGETEFARRVFLEAVDRINSSDREGLGSLERAVMSLDHFEIMRPPIASMVPAQRKPAHYAPDEKVWLIRKAGVLAGIGEFDKARELARPVVEADARSEPELSYSRTHGFESHLAALANKLLLAGFADDAEYYQRQILHPVNRSKVFGMNAEELVTTGRFIEAQKAAEKLKGENKVLREYAGALRGYYRRNNPERFAAIDRANKASRRASFLRLWPR